MDTLTWQEVQLIASHTFTRWGEKLKQEFLQPQKKEFSCEEILADKPKGKYMIYIGRGVIYLKSGENTESRKELDIYDDWMQVYKSPKGRILIIDQKKRHTN